MQFWSSSTSFNSFYFSNSLTLFCLYLCISYSCWNRGGPDLDSIIATTSFYSSWFELIGDLDTLLLFSSTFCLLIILQSFSFAERLDMLFYLDLRLRWTFLTTLWSWFLLSWYLHSWHNVYSEYRQDFVAQITICEKIFFTEVAARFSKSYVTNLT